MTTTCIGFFNYSKKETGKNMVCITLLTNPVPADKGSGYYNRPYYMSKDDFDQKCPDLKAGKVDVEFNAFNPYQIEKIKNV